MLRCLAMWKHLGHLLGQVWPRVLAWNSATAFSFWKELIIVPLVIFFLFWISQFGRNWYSWPVIKDKGWETLKPFLQTIAGLALIAVAVFIVGIPVVIYEDHVNLVEANRKLVSANDGIGKDRDEWINKAHAAGQTQPDILAMLSRVESLFSVFRRDLDGQSLIFVATLLPDSSEEMNNFEARLEFALPASCRATLPVMPCEWELQSGLAGDMPKSADGLTVYGAELNDDTLSKLATLLKAWFPQYEVHYSSEPVPESIRKGRKGIIWLRFGK